MISRDHLGTVIASDGSRIQIDVSTDRQSYLVKTRHRIGVVTQPYSEIAFATYNSDKMADLIPRAEVYRRWPNLQYIAYVDVVSFR